MGLNYEYGDDVDAIKSRNTGSTAFYEFHNYRIPSYMEEGITAYIHHGRPLGGFLHKVFCNDFVGAVGKADDTNQKNLPAYAGFLYNEAPSGCWGSEEAVRAWIKAGGLEGIRKKILENE